MDSQGRRIRWRWLLLLAVIVAAPAWWASGRWPLGDAVAVPPLPEGVREELGERTDGGFFRLVDEEGREVTRTAWILSPGDSYIDEDNRLYRVTAVEGDEVRVEDRGLAEMPDPEEILAEAARPPSRWGALAQWLGLASRPNRLVGIYHTHSDESYVPTSGSPTEWTGDIYQVGRMLKDALEGEGYEVVWSQNNHNPHDGQAYLRSRRTAMELLRRRPGTLIDVHRDAIPQASEYLTRVGESEVARIRLVVGRQNANQGANLEYAKRMKALSDREHAGLIKGIFMAQGNYNQDLGPNTILLEFGTHTVSLADAQKAAQLFSKVIPAAAGMAPGTAAPAAGRSGPAAWRWVGWLLLLGVVGVVGYLLVNGGAWRRWSQRLGLSSPAGAGAEASEELAPPPRDPEHRDDEPKP
ncbi:stage II sporulation protein P [Limnochorda pilosa]|uniref:Stage II sporulation protein P n=1 Tax=Limnochorda pilosa TaxID=1555112 RepID=A0A0K2SLB0_LIMPI|nr:stage II sporulation protein P [Limnochorda pilosa]